MSLIPISLKRGEDRSIQIEWSDQTVSRWTAAELRKACPCATCREKHKAAVESPAPIKALPILSLAEARPIEVQSMRPVGNYAYNIDFSDGHNSGLFTFELLHRETTQA